MTATLSLTICCLLLAILFTVVAERRGARGNVAAWMAFGACYGICIGIVASLLGYFFSLGPLVAIALGVPAGLLMLITLAKTSE